MVPETLWMKRGAHWAKAPVVYAIAVKPTVDKMKVKLHINKQRDTQSMGKSMHGMTVIVTSMC